MTEERNNEVNNNNLLMGAIIVLLVIIAIMGYFLGKNSSTNSTDSTNTPTNNSNTVKGDTSGTTTSSDSYETLSITVYDDKRCTNCPTDQILEQLQKLPSIGGAEVVKKDFSDEGVSDYLKENEITALPLIVFSTNNFDVSNDPVQKDQSGNDVPKVNTFLESLATGEYTLAIGAQFNPFEKRSENGFLLLEKEKLKTIVDNSYIKGNKDAKISWIEFSDLECPYCAKLHNSGTPEDLTSKYGDDLNIIFNHFPLAFHNNAQVGAEILECLAEQKGGDSFYSLMEKSFKDEKSNKSYLIDEAVALGADKTKLEECLDSETYSEKVKTQMKNGGSMFGVTGTPGNVLINNETGEYEVISGAYPTSSFEEIIDKLLK